jgi:hypothetical protein
MNPFIAATYAVCKSKFDTALNEVMATNPGTGFIYNGSAPIAIASIERFKEAIWVRMYATGFMGSAANASDKTEWFWYQGNDTPRTVYGSTGLYYSAKHKPNYFSKNQKNDGGWFSNSIMQYANDTAAAKWLEYYKKYPIIKKWEDDANSSYKPPAPTPLPANELPPATIEEGTTTQSGIGSIGMLLIGGLAVTALVYAFWPSTKPRKANVIKQKSPNNTTKKVSRQVKPIILK